MNYSLTLNIFPMEPEQILLSPPPLKHNEIKSLLVDRMKKYHPSFRFLMSATGVYHFQRTKDFHDHDLKEALHFVFYMSDYSMHVSISSRLNPIHTLAPVYNTGFINPHVDLGAIVKNNGFFPSANTAYQFDGTVDSLIPIVDQAIDDFTTAGIPYLDQRFAALRSSALVKKGMEIIDSWEFDKTMLRNELNVQYRKARLRISNIRHPLFNQVAQQLANVPGQSPEDYQEIPRLAFELMELYCTSRIIS